MRYRHCFAKNCCWKCWNSERSHEDCPTANRVDGPATAKHRRPKLSSR